MDYRKPEVEPVFVWEEDFLSDRVTLKKGMKTIGHVEPEGTSWKVVNGEDHIATHPDRVTAMNYLLNFQTQGSRAE